jgi:hypothetical protein
MLLGTMSRSRSLSVSFGTLAGILVGGLSGYLWLYVIGLLSSYTEFARDPICGLLNGAIAGSIAGAWHGRQMSNWLRAI